MTMRMLIDARHPEETRVAVVKGSRIEEFDFESAERKQLKGNIYLAKVTRVEPSLQAAFVDYGGNRHGFLAFSEIHPDYYQIPKEDREALLREEAEQAAEEEALRAQEQDDEDHAAEGGEGGEDGEPGEPTSAGGNGEESAVERLRRRRMALRRRYKIQDVIHRRQVLLVQVVKEERGNKGAALTTYLSLAGRYCVLMPNTSHGGGISRKISNAADRKRLKSIMADLDLPRTMGCIVRTAGLERTKTEIKRDFDYLARLWDEIRETTLKSTAPALIYADNDLVKRAIRDIYHREIEEVIVEGEEGYRAARSFMKLLMPSHARRVKAYVDHVPLFQRFGVEDQLAAMYHPIVQLRSGGYLVINPTEALVSIDINSGRATREHNIEQTALSTNLEAAEEIARQLRLRDMAGLVVIDFIDMENSGNVRRVEKAVKEALKNDRARIQVGRISSFGLFEMSRQRLRTGVLEASTRQCPHCEGTGLIRTASSAGLSALRMLEDEAARGRGSRLLLRASQEAAFYVLNKKRAELAEIEDRFGVHIDVLSDGALEGARMTVESGGPPPSHAPRLPTPIVIEAEEDLAEIEEEDEDEGEEEEEEIAAEDTRGEGRPRSGEDERADGRRRRRRRRRRGRREDGEAPREGSVEERAEAADEELAEGDAEAQQPEPEPDGAGAEEGEARRRRRRGRRAGRRRAGETSADAMIAEAEEAGVTVVEPAMAEPDGEMAEAAPAIEVVAAEVPETVEAAPAPRRRRRKAETPEPGVEAAPAPETEAVKPKRTRRKAMDAEAPQAAADAVAAKPRRRARAKSAANDDAAPEQPVAAEPDVVAAEEAEDASPRGGVVTLGEQAPSLEEPTPQADDQGEQGPPRRGWWQRTFGN